MFPVNCNRCGYRLADVYDLPCPECGCAQATVSMEARMQSASSGRATVIGHQTIEVMKWDWPYILLLIAVILISGIPAYFLSGWPSVIVSWLFSALSAYVGFYALTKILRTIRVF
jgi:hypothetical protein